MNIQGYKILNKLGAGATSEVYRAINLDTDSEVALKCFSKLVTSDKEMIRRLELESTTLEELQDPNIIKLHKTFKDDSNWGLELEFIDGNSLDEWMNNTEIKLLAPKIWILSEILKGLSYAHSNGVIHRDLKPENILISNEGSVKLTDFGLAKTLTSATITKSGLLIGSLAYMPPEILDLSNSTKKSDIYSFGVIAYELLANTLPFKSKSPQSLIREITTDTPEELCFRNTLVPKEISDLVMSCMNRDPSMRPKSTYFIFAELMNYLDNSSSTTNYKLLVKTPLDIKVYNSSLEERHSLIEQELSSDCSIEKLMFIHNNLLELFPESELIPKVQVLISNLSKEPSSKKYILLLLFLIFGFLGFKFLPEMYKDQAHLSETKKQIEIKEVIAPKIEKMKSLPIKKTTPKKRKVVKIDFGYINFEIPKDIKVFVDNIEVPTRSLKKYQARPGERKVRFEKPGYDPIDGKVIVRKDNTSIVRIGGV